MRAYKPPCVLQARDLIHRLCVRGTMTIPFGQALRLPRPWMAFGMLRRLGRVLAAVGVLAILSGPAALGEPPLAISVPAVSPLEDVLHRGEALETERRWADAVAHYEEALRQFPHDAALRQRFAHARRHYEVTRRYHDRSFRALLGRLSPAEATALYAEVLLKIQAHYVETPQWSDLVEAGNQGLAAALEELDFLQAHGLWGRPLPAAGFLEDARARLANHRPATRAEACQWVATTAALAQQRLGISPTAVILEYTSAAASSLDPYSAYLTPDQLSDVYAQIRGNFVGLGIELKPQANTLVIVRVIANSPAKAAGLREGDRIVGVDGQPATGLPPDRVAAMLQGPEGSVVTLSVSGPNGQVRNVVARRQRVEVPSVDEAHILPGTDGVAYVKITGFQETTARDLDRTLWDLYRRGMKSLIVDLRGNPGGLLRSAVETADLFLQRGVIVTTRGRSVQEDFTYSAHEPGTWGVPLAVLIDQESASAAEIFAGAIREHQRGTVIGKRSYGKGSVQGIFALNVGQAGLRLTTARFYSPSGRPYSAGVEPQIVVHQTARPLADALDRPLRSEALADPRPIDDPFLLAALETLRQPVAQR